MRASWMIALTAGAAIAVAAPPELAAQGRSSRAQQQQELQRQRQQAREAARRAADRQQAAERERLRRQQAANRAGLVLRRSDTYERAQRDRDRRSERYDPRNVYDRRDDRYDRRNDRYDRRGPAFCRSGEGHPVWGRQWCRDKGFGLGRDRAHDIWGDIIFRDRRYSDRRMDHSVLGRILGPVMLGRFDSYGRTYYGTGALSGRWLDSGASVLQLYMGSTPIARLIDTNRDGRVDNVSLLR